jgi:phenylalanyl-tRNA synthetase beta subunit
LKKVREIDSVEVFDLYQWEHLPEHKKSIAVRYTLHTPSTKDAYTPDQLAEIMQKAIQAGEKTGASLR